VRDNGIGIAPEDLERIFKNSPRSIIRRRARPAAQGWAYPSAGVGGTARRQIVAESTGRSGLEGGSTFVIEIPVETSYVS